MVRPEQPKRGSQTVFLSAVSLASFVFAGGLQSGLTAPLSASVASRVEQSVISVRQATAISGRAVIISRDGFAITTGEVVFGPDGKPKAGLEAAVGTSRIGTLSVEGFDPVTDLALIRIRLLGGGTFVPATLASDDSATVVMTSLAGGVVRSEVTRKSVAGVMQLTQRYVPLVELRLEGGAVVLGGAPVFNPEGHLVGLLQASLVSQGSAEALDAPRSSSFASLNQGPKPAVTSFSLALSALRRVVEGFLSPEGLVRHPYIGLYFATSSEGGAIVGEVAKGGPSEKAGFEVGDVIILAGNRPIITAVDLATHLFNVPVGETVTFTLRREGKERVVRVVVSADPRPVQGKDLVRRRGTH